MLFHTNMHLSSITICFPLVGIVYFIVYAYFFMNLNWDKLETNSKKDLRKHSDYSSMGGSYCEFD